MPSDERVQRALDALEQGRQAFRLAVAAAHDHVRAYLATHGALARDRTEETRVELGQFAGARIDMARFAGLVGESQVLPARAEAIVRRCADVLQDVLERGDLLFSVEVQPGGDVRGAVEAALAEAGRAFGAVLTYQAVKTGAYCGEHHEPLLLEFPYARWNRAERQMGVPLVVKASAADVRAEALAEYLDGRQQVVLVLDDPCPPAPLARLVSPSVLVMQTDGDLARLATFAGPAIVALVPPSAARFVSDPAATPALEVQHLPAAPTRAVGTWSTWQQREQLAHLARLVALEAAALRPEPVPVATALTASPAAPSLTTPTATLPDDERALGALTGWLLAQAGLATEPAGAGA